MTSTLEIPADMPAGFSRDDEMNNDERRWVSQEIQRKIEPAVKNAVAEVAEELRPKGWRKAVRLMRELGPIATIIGVQIAMLSLVVALASIAGTQYHAANARLADQARFEERTNRKLEGIEKSLEQLLAISTIGQAAQAQPGEMAKKLPAIHKSLQTAKAAELNISDQNLASIQKRLLTVTETSPGYWPLTFDLIAYRSILLTGMNAPPRKLNEISDLLSSHGFSLIENTAVRLGGVIERVKFRNTWVEFDLSRPLTLVNVHFENCVLVFRGLDVSVPSPAYRQIGRQILASTVSDVKVTTGS